jgi:hypothetical protein
MYCNTKKRRENEESKNKTKNIIAIKLKILIKKGGGTCSPKVLDLSFDFKSRCWSF